MAYAVGIVRRCQTCKRRASYEVFSRVNGSCGYFCARCAEQAVKRLAKKEAACA